MNETRATASLRRAVRAVGYDGVINDYFLVRTTRFDPRGELSEDDLAAEHISGMRWWRH